MRKQTVTLRLQVVYLLEEIHGHALCCLCVAGLHVNHFLAVLFDDILLCFSC